MSTKKTAMTSNANIAIKDVMFCKDGTFMVFHNLR
jgi:hypothetical protein